MINEMPRILISVLNWHNIEDTINTLLSIKNINYSNYKILFIDNASGDESPSIIRSKFDNIEVIVTKTNLGYAGGHKIAADYAIKNNYEALWILNNDVIVKPDSLTELVNAYLKQKKAIYGSITLNEDEKTISYGGGAEMIDKWTVDRNSGYNKYGGQILTDGLIKELFKETSDLNGASIFIPCDIIKAYGFMDTKWFLYGEETDYCLTLSSKYGISSIVIPQSMVIHKGSATMKMFKELTLVKDYYFTRNINLLYKKHYKDKIKGFGGFLHLAKFFTLHFVLFNKTHDFEYWKKYYIKLGQLHSLLRLRGKQVSPEKFIKKYDK
jgi:GT2 family glycosyltransferase